MSKVLMTLGSLLLVLGGLALLVICNVGFRTVDHLNTPGQMGVSVMLSVFLMAAATLVLIIPGLLFLVLGRRRS